MSVYNLDKLMEETRRLAAEYRRSTGSTLPVSSELARHDAINLLGLSLPAEPERSVDALMHGDGEPSESASPLKVQIKARVIFDPSKTKYRLGQLDMEAAWDFLMLVLMDADYQTSEIYGLDKASLESALFDDDAKQNARGALSVAKMKAIGRLMWNRASSEPLDAPG